MGGWKKETDWTTVEALRADLHSPPTKVSSCIYHHASKRLRYPCDINLSRQYHDPDLLSVEQEILDWYRSFGNFLNVVAHSDPSRGKAFFEMEDYSIFDLMGNLERPNLSPHYDHITPYLGKTNQSFRNVEIVAVTPEFGYITSLQRVHGTAADGSPYNMTFRATSIARKVEGAWKLVHEHYSFPVDMATKVADFTSSQGLSENVEFRKHE